MPQPKDKTKIKEWKQKIANTLKGRRNSISTEFSRGHTPFNKGTKGVMKANKGSFKKGNKPLNYMGGLKICKDGIYAITDEKYKTGDRKYENLARKKYREHYGEFDKNMVVIHLDGDCYNNEIKNLKLITRGELLKRNSYKTKKFCVICGKEFLARRKINKTCGKECRKEYHNLLNKEYQSKHRKQHRESNKKYELRKKAEKLLLKNETTKPKHLNSVNMY